MAICNWCEKDMSDKNIETCIKNTIVRFSDGTELPASIEHLSEKDGRCHDCGIKHGGYHHPGCDVEKCPKCMGQLISCECLLEEED